MLNDTFLTAEWRKLAIANYAIDPAILKQFIPAGTTLDIWKEKCYISLVGFMFLHTKLKGFAVPCHRNFQEVNLRFYVKHQHGSECRRGVVFIREIVPLQALTLVANRFYGENYVTMPMSHAWLMDNKELTVEYGWKTNVWNRFSVKTDSDSLSPVQPGSEEEFITEHYWGYTKINNSVTSQYRVEHPRWNVYKVHDHSLQVDFEKVYGKEFRFLSDSSPDSVMLAEGSVIAVKKASRIINMPASI